MKIVKRWKVLLTEVGFFMSIIKIYYWHNFICMLYYVYRLKGEINMDIKDITIVNIVYNIICWGVFIYVMC